MRKFVIKFRGVDDFNRPVFKVVDEAIYFGSTNILVPDKDRFPKGTKEEINEYFRQNWHEIELFGKLIIYPKGDKLLITRSGEWKSGAVEWLKENVIIEKSVL